MQIAMFKKNFLNCQPFGGLKNSNNISPRIVVEGSDVLFSISAR